ncbi:MAG: hypothetical protein HY471_00045 [Candidatus Sungbacteria bacterium]|nr:hypothetical protein [Candidatus Sungbacteria bacterium]
MRLYRFKKHIRFLSRQVAPRPIWKQEARAAILAEIRKSEVWRESIVQKQAGFWEVFRIFGPGAHSMRAAFIAILAIAVVFSSSFAAVSAAQASLPGDALYSFKLSVEKAQIGIAFSQEKKAALEIAFAGTRLEEVSKLLDEGDPRTAANGIETAMSHFTKSLSAVEERLEKTEPGVSKLVNEKTLILEDNLLKIKEKIAESSSAAVAPEPAGPVAPSLEAPSASSSTPSVAEKVKSEGAEGNPAPALPIASIDAALEKVDETNSKSLTVFVQEAALSSNQDIKQEALSKLQNKIEKIETTLNQIASTTTATSVIPVLSRSSESSEVSNILSELQVGTASTTRESTPEQIMAQEQPAATTTPAVLQSVQSDVQTVKERPEEARKAINEAKKILEGNEDGKLQEAIKKVNESTAIVKEVRKAIKNVESFRQPGNEAPRSDGGVLGTSTIELVPTQKQSENVSL